MTDYEMLKKARAFARKAHGNETDKAGELYIIHPVTVALLCSSTDEKVVALLHDVVEDTEYTFDDIQKEGFPERIVESLKYLTHDWDECGYEEYVDRLAKSGDMTAIRVKIADLTHNTDTSRLEGKKPFSYDKYVAALEKLKALT